MNTSGIGMRKFGYALALSGLFFAAHDGLAQVSVAVNGNVATAMVQLPSTNSTPYTAEVTITFDNVANLTPASLNLNAYTINPNTPPQLPSQVDFDSGFPVMIEVEPTVALFRNGFDEGQFGEGNLDFLNTYLIEIHTPDLDCGSPTSQYRLFKAPHGSDTFADVTSALKNGSVRARGRGGAFSRFLIAKDSRPQGSTGVPMIKSGELHTRLQTSGITDTNLLSTLNTLLAQIDNSVQSANYNSALGYLDSFINTVQANAGNKIVNEWRADRILENDAGDLLSLAATMQFSLNISNGSPVCTTP
jgi:hypothetical protein